MPGYSSNLNQGYNEDPGVNWGRVAGYAAGGVMALGLMRMGVARTMGTARAQRGVSKIKGIAGDFKKGWSGSSGGSGGAAPSPIVSANSPSSSLSHFNSTGAPTIAKAGGRRGQSYGSQLYGKYKGPVRQGYQNSRHAKGPSLLNRAGSYAKKKAQTAVLGMAGMSSRGVAGASPSLRPAASAGRTVDNNFMIPFSGDFHSSKGLINNGPSYPRVVGAIPGVVKKSPSKGFWH